MSGKVFEISMARDIADSFKYEVAEEIGVPLTRGYNGDLKSSQNGAVGGQMYKRMLEAYEGK